MIELRNWALTVEPGGRPLARQYDNRTGWLVITGDIPEGYDWYLKVLAEGDRYDEISLARVEDGIGVELTRAFLAVGGYYRIQLMGVARADSDCVRHTNVATVYIPPSLSGDGTWPELPTAFGQAEARLISLNAHPPIPGGNGFWEVWDLESGRYVESLFPLPAGTGGFRVGNGLRMENGVLSVDAAEQVEEDNTKPVTSAAVYVEIGNIESLLRAL